MFSASAYQSMGKLANPMTGKSERNLEAAQGFIDILIMLKKRTVGNLSPEESKILESTISDLELNFVQEKNKPEPAKKEEEQGGETGKSTEEHGGAGKSGEEQGEEGKSTEKQGEAGKGTEKQGEGGKSGEEQGEAGKSTEKQREEGKSTEEQGEAGDVKRGA